MAELNQGNIICIDTDTRAFCILKRIDTYAKAKKAELPWSKKVCPNGYLYIALICAPEETTFEEEPDVDLHRKKCRFREPTRLDKSNPKHNLSPIPGLSKRFLGYHEKENTTKSPRRQIRGIIDRIAMKFGFLHVYYFSY